MPDTPLGIPYPASTGHTRLWEHLQGMADELDALLTDIKADYEGAWGSYTPVWSGTGASGPSLGNGTITGHYKRVGNTVFVRVVLTLGSTSSAGTGTVYRISLPVAAKVGSLLDVFCVGTSGAPYSGNSRIVSASTTGDNMRMAVTDNASVGNTVPFAWANGHQLLLHGEYEADA